MENIAEFWSEVWDWGDGVVASERWTEVSGPVEAKRKEREAVGEHAAAPS